MVRRTTYLGIDPGYDSKHVTTPSLLAPTSLFISSSPLLELSPNRIRPRDLFISLCLPLRLYVSTTRSNWRIPSRTPSAPPRNSPRNVPCNTFFRSKTSFNRKYFIRIVRRALNGCRGGQSYFRIECSAIVESIHSLRFTYWRTFEPSSVAHQGDSCVLECVPCHSDGIQGST